MHTRLELLIFSHVSCPLRPHIRTLCMYAHLATRGAGIAQKNTVDSGHELFKRVGGMSEATKYIYIYIDIAKPYWYYLSHRSY